MLSTEIASRPREVAMEAARLAKKILGPGVEMIWFGSWPRGRAQPHSDIDLALSAGRPIPREQLAALRDAVDDIPTLFEVELVDLSTVGSSLREAIRSQGVGL